MADKGVAIVYKGERKNLRGRYSDGSCIQTPKGFFLWHCGRWWIAVENSDIDIYTGRSIVDYDFEPIKKD